ncbi:MAG: TetR/AcrR family transcriptional regulator [Cocleimonas sp.]
MNVGRPLQFNPDKALGSAMQLFWNNGYESTSLQDLLTAMKLSKSSFYQAFKSKKQLFLNTILSYQALLVDDLLLQLKQADTGKAFIENLFSCVAEETVGVDARRGCLLMNTASEFAQTDDEIADLVSESLVKITAIFERAVVQAQQEGDISANKDAHDLAVYLLSNMSGLKNMVKAGADKETITSIVDTILLTLGDPSITQVTSKND